MTANKFAILPECANPKQSFWTQGGCVMSESHLRYLKVTRDYLPEIIITVPDDIFGDVKQKYNGGGNANTNTQE